MIDASIYNVLSQPRKTALDYADEYQQRDLQRANALQQQQMNALQLRGAQRAEQEDQAWRNYLTSGADMSTPEGQRKAMVVAPRQAGVYMTQQADLAAKRANTAKDQAAADKSAFDLHKAQVDHGLTMAVNGSTPDAVRQSVSDGVAKGLWSMREAQQILHDMPTNGDPAAFGQWRMQQLQTALSAKDQLDQYMKQREFGLKQQEFGLNVRKADDLALHNRNTEALTARGQNMTDARARDKNQIDREAVGKVEWKQDVNGNWIALPKEVRGNGPVTPVATTTAGKREMQARNAVDIINEAEPLIDQGTGSYVGAGIDQAYRMVGASTPGAEAGAKLKALEGALMMAQPRMEGPQSDKDVALYRQMAAQIGDPTVPASQKKAAIQTIKVLHQRYTGQAPQQSGAPRVVNFGDLK